MNNLPNESFECKNLQSAVKFSNSVSEIIKDEVNKGYLSGPYNEAPFSIYRVSPIGVVSKRNSSKMRLIVDLSAPHDDASHASLNDLICKQDFSLTYVRIDDAIKIIKRYGVGTKLCKTDITDAFRLIPIRADLQRFYGIKWRSKYYFYTKLAFGSRSSPKIFDSLSTAICWIANHNYSIENILHLLDDFLTIDPPWFDADITMRALMSLFSNLNIPLAAAKTVGPTTCLEYLGIILDTILMQARLPPDKLAHLVLLLESFMQKSSCTKRELQSLLGHLNFACRTIVPGRSFISRLLEIMKSAKRQNQIINLTEESKEDIKMWFTLLSDWNGISFFLEDEFTQTTDMELYTDSSGIGFGGYFKGQWFSSAWPSNIKARFLEHDLSIAFLELYPIVIAAILWGSNWCKKRIVFRCDNSATVMILQKGRSKCKHIMQLVRRLVLIAAKHNFSFNAKHVPGVCNQISDSLSRLQELRFRRLAPEAQQHPMQIPSEVLFI